MATTGPRSSIACLYNMKPTHQQIHDDSDVISPMSTLQNTPDMFKSQPVVVSPVDSYSTYFPDEKISMPIQAYDGIEVVAFQPQRLSAGLEVVSPHPPEYFAGAQVKYIDSESELPARTTPVPFWRRYILWILAGILIVILIIVGVVVGVHKGRSNAPISEKPTEVLAGSNATSTADTADVEPTKNVTSYKLPVDMNSTMQSVASSVLTAKDGSFNIHLFSQNGDGSITLQVSLDGETFEPVQNVSLSIQPRIGSPLSATAEQDSNTGVVMINLFYISGDKTVSNITMSSITCPANSAKCNTLNNYLLPTKIPTSLYTGLTAVNVNNALDWRVYYLDTDGSVSQLMGNSSGFDGGVTIGGTGLGKSSLAAVNYNHTTNNINLFYVDSLTKNLFKMQYTGATENGWTTPSAVSLVKDETWSPYAAIGAAYNEDQDTMRLYYSGLDLGIYEYRGVNASLQTNTVWDPVPGRNKVWAEAGYVGADITAVGFEDTVHFYRIKSRKMVQATLEDTEWTEDYLTSS